MDLLTTTLLHYFKDTPIILVSELYFSSTKLFYQGRDLIPVGIVIKSDFTVEFNFPYMPNNVWKAKAFGVGKDQKVRFQGLRKYK